jgi:hypothetical protein
MERLNIGEKVTLRHPVFTRLNGLKGTVIMFQGDHYSVALVTGERVSLHRQYLISEHYNNDAPVTLQCFYEQTGFFPEEDTISKAIT